MNLLTLALDIVSTVGRRLLRSVFNVNSLFAVVRYDFPRCDFTPSHQVGDTKRQIDHVNHDACIDLDLSFLSAGFYFLS